MPCPACGQQGGAVACANRVIQRPTLGSLLNPASKCMAKAQERRFVLEACAPAATKKGVKRAT